MNIKKFMEIISIAENLKNNTRHSWTSSNRHESIGGTQLAIIFDGILGKDEFPDADINKVILMCIFMT